MAFTGVCLLVLGLGTALDFVVAQSHPVSPQKAPSLKIEYSIVGTVLFLSGVVIARKGFRSESGTE